MTTLLSAHYVLVCRKVSDKSAIEWIHEFTDEDIRWYLRNTDHSLQEVADALGFATVSSFGKYVRQRFGCSPSKIKSIKMGQPASDSG